MHGVTKASLSVGNAVAPNANHRGKGGYPENIPENWILLIDGDVDVILLF